MSDTDDKKGRVGFGVRADAPDRYGNVYTHEALEKAVEEFNARPHNGNVVLEHREGMIFGTITIDQEGLSRLSNLTLTGEPVPTIRIENGKGGLLRELLFQGGPDLHGCKLHGDVIFPLQLEEDSEE